MWRIETHIRWTARKYFNCVYDEDENLMYSSKMLMDAILWCYDNGVRDVKLVARDSDIEIALENRQVRMFSEPATAGRPF